ncbi:Ku protein [Sinorhizobium meliloti]|nr:Ku protein [Sinorhizobium meliloti]
MAGPRANWRGFVRCGQLSAPVALYSASTASERIAFNILNRKTGNPVKREYFDSSTDEVVGKDDQIKGYEIENGQFVTLEAKEVAAAVPESDKTITIDSFLPDKEIDSVYFDKPYYLTPDRLGSAEFTLLLEGMRRANVGAIGRTVLFRRMRTLMLMPDDDGMIAVTMHSDYEVRSSEQAFDHMPELNITGEMLDLAKHIIKTKVGSFQPADFKDRYEASLADLVKAKLEGRTLPTRPEPRVSKPTDLLKALRESAEMAGAVPVSRRTPGKKASGEASGAKPKRKSTSTAKRQAG